MRIPFPKYIPLRPLIVFLTVMLFFQLVEGTDAVFALLMIVAQVAAIAAFNILGGMTHMSGAFCFFALLPNVTVPELTHMILGQPGDFNLEHPIMTAGVCAVFFSGVMGAAWLTSLAKPVEPLLDRIPFSILELRIIAAIAAVYGVAVNFAVLRLNGPLPDGTLIAALYHFCPDMLAIAVILATYVRLNTTNGRSCMSWYIGILLVLTVLPGLLNAQKEGMLTPILCWLLVVAASGHRFSRVGVLALLGAVAVLWSFVFPFSTNARFPVRQAETVADKVGLIFAYIQDPNQFPDAISYADSSEEFGTQSSKVNIVRRYSLLKSIDMLVGADLKAGYTSIDRYLPILISVVPHALWPDRPDIIHSNELGHKAGFPMSEDDEETGIAIGSPALYFDIGGWLALMIYPIICFLLFFYATIRLIGRTTAGIWALVPIGTEAHISSVASPAAMFGLVVQFLGMFFFAVAILKLTGYLMQSLLSRSVAIQETTIR